MFTLKHGEVRTGIGLFVVLKPVNDWVPSPPGCAQWDVGAAARLAGSGSQVKSPIITQTSLQPFLEKSDRVWGSVLTSLISTHRKRFEPRCDIRNI